MNLGEATEQALVELTSKSAATINYETALVWGGRALASFILFERTADVERLLDAEDYMHEALEHASLSGDAALLDTIRGPLFTASERARKFAASWMRVR